MKSVTDIEPRSPRVHAPPGALGDSRPFGTRARRGANGSARGPELELAGITSRVGCRRHGAAAASRRRACLWALSAGLFALALGDLAVAEQTAGVDTARSHFLRGVDRYQEGNYEAALADFEEAYALAPHFALLYNIGRVRAELRLYPEAVLALERYLAEGGGEVPADRRRDVGRELGRLRGLVGRLTIAVERELPTTVYVDDREAGSTPMSEPLLVSAGRRTIELRAEGHLPFRREVAVAGGTEQRLRVNLVPAATTSGSIFVSSPVPGLALTLDGEPVGTTPLAEPLSASPGRHLVEGSRPGYEPAARAVVVEAGQLASVDLHARPLGDLAPADSGELRLEVSERDAEVLVDGSPFAGGALPTGEHVLEVQLPGFHPWTREIDVAPGAQVRVEAELVPTEGFLERYRRRARTWQIVSWTTVGVGLAALGTFIGLDQRVRAADAEWWVDRADMDARYEAALALGLSLTEALEWEAAYAASDERRDELRLQNWLYVAGMAISGGIIATGIVLAFVGPSPWRYNRIAFAPGPGSFALALAW